MSDEPRRLETIIRTRVDVTSYELAAAAVLDWSQEARSRYVVAANVYTVMQAFDSDEYSRLINAADLVTPDGMPLVWALRLRGHADAARVYGPTLMLKVCALAEERQVPIGLYGGTDEVLSELAAALQRRFPRIVIACRIAPPFRPLTPDEDRSFTAAIADSAARILFVGTGSPRQEQWMAAHRERLPLVMLGVGAAFDFYAGRVRQAPGWMQAAGLEWLFRLIVEPRRLWRRYLIHNPRFVFHYALQLFHIRDYA